jgi:hypothetical protein
MNEDKKPSKHSVLPDGWNNCPKCGWAYLQSKLDNCPMCRHPWRNHVGYSQPAYEPPGLQ